MNEVLRQLLGPAKRVRPSGLDAWREIEEWIGRELPEDFKEFVDEYGDCRIMEFLAIAHPCGRDPLLQAMKDDREALEMLAAQYRNELGVIPFDPLEAVGWATHDYDGDTCYFLPRDGGKWAVMIAYRQYGMVAIDERGFTDFMIGLLCKEKVPRGWPVVEPVWRSIEDSPVI